jgi:hypothetical protein
MLSLLLPCCVLQNPTLDLLPHVAAPGGDVPVRTMDGSKDKASGAHPDMMPSLHIWLTRVQQVS